MSNSSLVDYTKISPNKNSPRNSAIKKITIHHMAGNMTIENCGAMFARPERRASSNYAIGTDGRVAMYVEEKDRSWCSGNADNDHQAITIEVANDGGSPDWHVSDKALAKLIDLCVDICKRNGIEKLNFTGNKNGNLTMHKYFQATACPGKYLESKFPYIADEVNKRLNPSKPESPSDSYKTYTVKSGDSFWKIAEEQMGSGSKYKELAEFNGMATNSVIKPGDVLKIPTDSNVAPPKPEIPSKPETSFFPAKGYWGLGDKHENVAKIADFMYRVFPAYTSKLALGDYYGKNIKESITTFQKRTGLEADGNTGPITLAGLKKYGFTE